MPRQYVSASQFLASPYAGALGADRLGVTLDVTLARASARADSYCRRQLGLPGTTTLSADASAGATVLSLASSLGIDPGPEMVLLIGTGGTQETVRVGEVQPLAGVGNPFPATVTLYPGVSLTYSHSGGEPVAASYYEQQNPLGSSTNRVDEYWDMTQAGQIARAHAPHPLLGENVRVVFVRNVPIVQLQAVQIAYPWANDLDTASISNMLVKNDEGWVRFVLGTFVPPDSVVYVTYTGGYATVPDDVQQAVLYYAASDLALGAGNPYGAQSVRSADASLTFGPTDRYVAAAEELLKPYRMVALG